MLLPPNTQTHRHTPRDGRRARQPRVSRRAPKYADSTLVNIVSDKPVVNYPSFTDKFVREPPYPYLVRFHFPEIRGQQSDVTGHSCCVTSPVCTMIWGKWAHSDGQSLHFPGRKRGSGFQPRTPRQSSSDELLCGVTAAFTDIQRAKLRARTPF